ncbi:hypothetical protein ACROYT_G043946 [Oculina patagonica]
MVGRGQHLKETRDITYWYVTEDVGRCKEICHKNNVPTEGNTKGYSCIPTEMVSKSYQLIGDTKYKSVIRKCGYQHTSGPCRRLSLYKTFFKGTTYTRRHDVGFCVGVCGIDGHECKAIDSQKKVVTGPNGDLSVSVIKKCGCVRPECQRVAFREVYKRKTEKGWIQEMLMKCEEEEDGDDDDDDDDDDEEEEEEEEEKVDCHDYDVDDFLGDHCCDRYFSCYYCFNTCVFDQNGG